jgi:hypothetical protein
MASALSTSSLLTATAVGTFFLYILLAPGLVLTLPGGSQGRCAQLVPSPTNTAAGHDCGEDSEDAILADICHARSKCTKAWASGYTNVGAVFLHAFLFVILVGLAVSQLAPKRV